MDNIVDSYIEKISKIPLLSKEEEKLLASQLLEGSEDAKQKLIESNLRLVVSIAKKYLGRGLDFIDLIDEGNVALQFAVSHYDVRKGTCFSTFASRYINGGIKKAVNEKCCNIRIPQYDIMLKRQIDKAKDYLSNLLNRTPTEEEIARECKLSKNVVSGVISMPNPDTVSLNQIISDESDDVTLEDTFVADINILDIVIRKDLEEKIHLLLNDKTLTINERKVLIYKYFKRMRPTIIAKIYGSSRQYINNLEKSALKKLSGIIDIDDMSEYLDNPSKGVQYLKERR